MSIPTKEEREAKKTALRADIEKRKLDLRAAERALEAHESTFYPGEQVRVNETCRRGYCKENDFTGVIVKREHNGLYEVRTSNEETRSHIYSGCMVRIEP